MLRPRTYGYTQSEESDTNFTPCLLDALFGTIVRDRCHVLRHLCQERPMIRYELRARPHPFALPIKDNQNFISRLIYKNIY